MVDNTLFTDSQYQPLLNIDINQHQHKVLVIIESYTIINEWTMMVHLQYTLLTDRTMV